MQKLNYDNFDSEDEYLARKAFRSNSLSTRKTNRRKRKRKIPLSPEPTEIDKAKLKDKVTKLSNLNDTGGSSRNSSVNRQDILEEQFQNHFTDRNFGFEQTSRQSYEQEETLSDFSQYRDLQALLESQQKADSRNYQQGKKRKRATDWELLPPRKKSEVPSSLMKSNRQYIEKFAKSGLASKTELSSVDKMLARVQMDRMPKKHAPQYLDTLESFSDFQARGSYAHIANNLLWRQNYKVAPEKLLRTRGVEKITPQDLSGEPVCHPNQRLLRPFVNMDNETGEKIRTEEDFLTMLFREAWSKVPETRDEHRREKEKMCFSTSAERRFIKMYEQDLKYPEKNLFRMDKCAGVRSILRHAWGLNFRLQELQRTQYDTTRQALENLVNYTDPSTPICRESLKAIIAQDNKAMGVQWYLMETIADLVEGCYSPPDNRWNKNTTSRVEFLISDLREKYDFLTPRERYIKRKGFGNDTREYIPPMDRDVAKRCSKRIKQQNAELKISESGEEKGLDKIAKEASKALQQSEHFLRI